MLLSRSSHVQVGNQILDSLSRQEYSVLFSALERVHLARSTILYHQGQAISHVFFMSTGMVSLLATTQAGLTTEVSMVSNEGLIGVPALLGIDRSPYEIRVQIPGQALRVRTSVLIKEFGRKGPLQEMVFRYIHCLISQISQSAACNRFHQLDERLCRWLLTCHDHVKSDTLYLTHEMLSHMLGATRANVTAATNHLNRQSLIRSRRGSIQILDREGLKAEACECYRMIVEQVRCVRAA